ncbi:MAG: hypothetical protein V2I36_03955 [Desulfopila sp.]|nr:hypothetical protein [Desulfopila sp.]
MDYTLPPFLSRETVSESSITCPSCHAKKEVQFGHHLKETALYPVPHRQHVFSILKILRRFFFFDRKLLGKLSHRLLTQ